MTDVGRVPPQAVEVERQVIGAMLIDSSAPDRVFAVISEDDMYDPTNRRFMRAIRDLHVAGTPIDVVTVTQQLRKDTRNGDINDPVIVLEMTSEASSGANAEYHAAIVREQSILRQMIVVASDITSRAYGEDNAHELIQDVETKLIKLSNSSLTNRDQPLSHGIQKVQSFIQAVERGDHEAAGGSCGYRSIDDILCGLESDLYIVAGRPSQGKTALALNFANRMGKAGHGIGFFSLETSERAISMRSLSIDSHIEQWKFRKGRLTSEDYVALNKSAKTLSEMNFRIDDTSSLTLFELKARIRRARAEFGIDRVFIDYLGLLAMPKANSTNDAVGMMTRGIKGIARDLDIPIFLLCQLSRDSVKRDSKIPALSDLRDSGNIEQDAYGVIFVHRPETYSLPLQSGGPSEGMAEVIIAKNKDGGIGTVEMTFIKEQLRFEEAAPFTVTPPLSSGEPKQREEESMPF